MGPTKKDHGLGRGVREAAAILKQSVTEPRKDSSGVVVYLSSGDSWGWKTPATLCRKHEPPLIVLRGVRFRANTIVNRTQARVPHR